MAVSTTPMRASEKQPWMRMPSAVSVSPRLGWRQRCRSSSSCSSPVMSLGGPHFPLGSVAAYPFAGAAGQRFRPFRTERRVSVQIHQVSSLAGLSCLAALSLQGGPDGPTYSGTRRRRTPGSAPASASPGSRDRRSRLRHRAARHRQQLNAVIVGPRRDSLAFCARRA
jgi:hypothetical protein